LLRLEISQYRNIGLMADRETYRVHAEVFAALGNPLRHELFHYLVERPQTVSELAEKAGVSASNVSQHLAVLAAHDLAVKRREDGRTVWEAGDRRLAGACSLVDEVMAERLASRLTSLEHKEARHDAQ
jgi:DNA-binding transcriptional ArsR family regulator